VRGYVLCTESPQGSGIYISHFSALCVIGYGAFGPRRRRRPRPMPMRDARCHGHGGLVARRPRSRSRWVLGLRLCPVFCLINTPHLPVFLCFALPPSCFVFSPISRATSRQKNAALPTNKLFGGGTAHTTLSTKSRAALLLYRLPRNTRVRSVPEALPKSCPSQLWIAAVEI
jgi:hypothetical protein